ncbi:N-acetyl-gamma-glutamyl-phosphate reductase [Achromatium sp. WMS2]|nr:N-acetyl-gamma-glutamyl-phosphate reductase [Achromatium sp. WMS2]
MLHIGIVGGTGYTGSELIRILCKHPNVELTCITSRGDSGTSVNNMFPNLRGHVDTMFSTPEDAPLKECDLVFFATPNGVAMHQVPELLAAGVKIIDLAADFRLKDPALWKQWYGIEHQCPELLTEVVYGLPELNREAIGKARLVANPGCYPTAVLLGFIPLLESRAVNQDFLIADAKSGVSGAGRKASVTMLMGETGESFKAYGIPGHRHWPEILQILQQVTDTQVGFTFVPHLVPMIRGIEATLYAPITNQNIDLQEIFMTRYANEPFVDVLPPGSHPETRWVRGINLCRLAVHRPHNGPLVVVSSVIDNLVKGAAGQAVQNMNIMLGLKETTGLDGIALQP